MAAPATPTNLSVWGPVKLGSTFKVTLSCDDAATITYTLRETSVGAVLFTVTSSQRVSPGYGSWYYRLPSDQLVNGTGYVEVYATNSDGTSGTVGKSFTVHIPPTVAITAPLNGATVSSLPLTVSWTATSADGVSEQHVSISKGADTVWERDIDPLATSVQLGASDVQLDTGSTYTAAVTARSGLGLEGSGTSSFTVSWTRPAAPSVSITNTTSSAQITVTAGAGGAATDHIMIERSDSRGVTVIADNLSSGSTFYDVIAPLGKEYKYFVYAVSALGATRTTTVTNTIPSTSWALTWRNGASTQTQLLAWNPQASYSMIHGGDLYHFADGGEGGGLPVWYGTTDRDESGTLKFDTIMYSDADALRYAVMAHPVMWLRDPFGHRWMAHVTLSYTHGLGQLWPVTLTWDAVRFEEV